MQEEEGELHGWRVREEAVGVRELLGVLRRGRRTGPSLGLSRRAFWRATSLLSGGEVSDETKE